MSRSSIELGTPILILTAMALMAGCDRGAPSPASPLPAPSATAGESVLPTPRKPALPGEILLQVRPADSPERSRLEASNRDGSEREPLTEVAPTLGSVAVSPDRRYVAFFTADTASDGSLTVRDLQGAEKLFQVPVPAEVSESFRDAVSRRYLAWAPDSQGLAVAMNRDLYLVDVSGQDAEVLVSHREDYYNLAGKVMGAIGHPVWSSDGTSIVYDAFSPPDVLTAGADEYRNVERVEVSTGKTTVLLEDAHIVEHAVAPDRGSLILENAEGQTFSLDLDGLRVQESPSLLDSQEAWLCDTQSTQCAWIMSEQGENDVLRVKLGRKAEAQDTRISNLEGLTSDCQFQSILWRPDSDTLLATVGCAGGAGLWALQGPDLDSTRLADWATLDSAALLGWLD